MSLSVKLCLKFEVFTSNTMNEKRIEKTIRVDPRNFTVIYIYFFFGVDFEKLKL